MGFRSGLDSTYARLAAPEPYEPIVPDAPEVDEASDIEVPDIEVPDIDDPDIEAPEGDVEGVA